MTTHKPNELAILNAAVSQLSAMQSVGDVLDVRDKAEAIRSYLRSIGAKLEEQNQAAFAKICAERRAGELLAGMPKHNGDPRLHDATRLADLGIEKTQSHRYQRIAGIPEDVFLEYAAKTMAEKRELTTADVLRMAKPGVATWTDGDASDSTTIDAATGCETTNALEPLVATGRKFGTIYADPPWQYGNQGTRASTDNHYPTMTVDAICNLPIADLAADKSHLHLWTTNAFLFDAKRVLDAWGFAYKSLFVWVKPQMGIGNYWRVSHEIMLLGVRGGLTFADHAQMSWLEAKRTAHSRKPERVRGMIEKVSPGPRLELFGRRTVHGWTVWGNQVERSVFDPESESDECVFPSK